MEVKYINVQEYVDSSFSNDRPKKGHFPALELRFISATAGEASTSPESSSFHDNFLPTGSGILQNHGNEAFSKSKNREGCGGSLSPGGPGRAPSHGPLAVSPPITALHNQSHKATAERQRPDGSDRCKKASLSPSCYGSSACDLACRHADLICPLGSRPRASETPLKDPTLCGIERQRPGSCRHAGSQSYASFPGPHLIHQVAQYQPLWGLGPFRPFQVSEGDFGGLSHPQPQPLPQSRPSSSSSRACQPPPDDAYPHWQLQRLRQFPVLIQLPAPKPLQAGDRKACHPAHLCVPPARLPSATQNAFPHESASNQEANGFAFLRPTSAQSPPPMSVNPLTGNVYPSRGTSRNPFI
ncbi:arf-GAP domain and FG repeat-containing protein 2-like isoform X2 [Lates japonicus]|uniref:Arf-GAP domain and FG repeat-containing protein 2-like isoform X2 n=1 Tax=Lates japonicus TaxID=270547 RepID=A0AAD3NJW7_LATJO|nr:arf-GAP domain and FG repeat-containing protein 2-like isoform X2 [Lates japonicus]